MLEESASQSCLELRITPLFLVPDTNCFIDHLDAINKLLKAKKFTIVVPLIGKERKVKRYKMSDA